MVSTLKVEFIGWATLLLLLLSCPRTYGVIGDCDGNGVSNFSDAVYIVAYIFSGGLPPHDFADCDCDGFPGVNIGDAQQIVGSVFSGASLYPWPGNDLIAPAATRMMISGRVNGTTQTKCFVFINNPIALSGGCTLPFSFAAKPGETDLDCTGVTIGPTFSGFGEVKIDSTAKTFLLTSSGTIAATTGWEVLCEADFVPQTGGNTGSNVTVGLTTISKLFPLLMSTVAYDGTNFKRMLFPRLVPDTFGTIGDVNCSGAVNISDAVYLIAFIFSGGNPPGDPDGDGIPDCPGL